MRFLKVVYFDEGSVADFMQIIAGGEIKKTTEFLSCVNQDYQYMAGLDTSISTESKGVSRLFSFLSGINLNLTSSAEANSSYNKDKIVKNILENTLLADFVELFRSDARRKPENRKCRGIEVFENKKIVFIHSSICGCCGYHVFEMNDRDKNIVLRFNASSFRNNYFVEDLKDMNLTVFGISVGENIFDIILAGIIR